MSIKEIVDQTQQKLQKQLNKKELAHGEIIYNNGNCQILSQSNVCFELILSHQFLHEPVEYQLKIDEDGTIFPFIDSDYPVWDRYSYACLLQVKSELHLLDPKEHTQHKKYSRKGMIKRVIKERMLKAEKADYHIKWAKNIYGDHILTNEKGVKYKIFLRDFVNETGYSNSLDSRFNKLGTTKHIMYAFQKLKEKKSLYKRLGKTCPFIEIFCDPLNDYKISWFYPHELPFRTHRLIARYFKNSHFIEDDGLENFLGFIEEASNDDQIVIRPEVRERLENAFEKSMLKHVGETQKPDFSLVKAELFDYQKQGVEFVLFKKAAIIADEMGLGKTLQAICSAVLKKSIFGFAKTLIVCPASLKGQWKSEIEKFSNEKALIVQGRPEERVTQYKNEDYFFYIVNYETVLRDSLAINNAGMDFLILDEAQKVKNYETKTASAVKRLQHKHIMVITGTPIENRLIDIYSIMSIVDPYFFGPLWEFSYQHCLFDPERPNKINGYYDLQKLNKKLEKVLIRREKRKVIDQLPNLLQIDIPVQLSTLQAEYHASYQKGIAQIIRKKFLTPYDLQRLQLLLANMRMVCDSTYLIDDQTNESPKLEELQDILLNKLDLTNQNRKIIIFSEWIKVHKLIGRILRDHNIGFIELNGKIPVKSRGDLIKKFETNPQYKIFLSTESGGAGLNLQVADTLINFELPWNPAKKNQRIGRIDRLGQKSKKLTVYNFISRESIEEQIAAGLLMKQDLFDGVLEGGSETDFVDFSTKGRSQFIEQLEQYIAKSEKDAERAAVEKVPIEEMEPLTHGENGGAQQELDFSGDAAENLQPDTGDESGPYPTGEKNVVQTEELEMVMNNGLEFLSGLFKMTTGKDMGVEDQKIEIDEETGEVTMKFKLPTMKPKAP